MISLRDVAFALDPEAVGAWSVKASLADHVFPEFQSGWLSLRELGQRFAAAGAALRSLNNGSGNLWSHLDRKAIVREISDRLRDPMIMRQKPTGLCGPMAVLVEFVRRRPVGYILAARQLLESGIMTCPTGRVIEAEAELRDEPVPHPIAQVDWLLAASMRDDENIWEDVDDDANGLESMTFWGEQRDWTRDVLNLANGGWEKCFAYGEISCMKKAEQAVKTGGVAFFLVDANLIKDGGSDDEEEMWWRRSVHKRRKAPTEFQSNPKRHSKDDCFPPDHWVVYLGGLNLGDDPGDLDPVSIDLWSWGRRYRVTGTVEAFTEYVYAVVTGH